MIIAQNNKFFRGEKKRKEKKRKERKTHTKKPTPRILQMTCIDIKCIFPQTNKLM